MANEIMNIDGVECYEIDGTAYLRLETVARGLGFTQVRNGEEYIRWGTVNNHLEKLGFPNKLGKDDFIPENVFYRLAMKAKNKVAEAFQAKVADEIIPAIRKTGSYMAKSNQKQLAEQNETNKIEKAKLLDKIAQDYAGTTYQQILQAHAVKELTGEMLLPLPKLERQTYSAGDIGKMLGVSSKKVGAIANKYNLKKSEYGQWFKDKSPYSDKEVSTFRYYDNAVPLIKCLLLK